MAVSAVLYEASVYENFAFYPPFESGGAVNYYNDDLSQLRTTTFSLGDYEITMISSIEKHYLTADTYSWEEVHLNDIIVRNSYGEIALQINGLENLNTKSSRFISPIRNCLDISYLLCDGLFAQDYYANDQWNIVGTPLGDTVVYSTVGGTISLGGGNDKLYDVSRAFYVNFLPKAFSVYDVDGGDGVDTIYVPFAYAESNIQFASDFFSVDSNHSLQVNVNSITYYLRNMELIAFSDIGYRIPFFTEDADFYPFNGNGSIQADFIDALGGDDIIYSGESGDTVYGGSGNDGIYSEAGDDYVAGGQGDDYVNGGDGNDTLRGDQGNDSLNGDYGNDVFFIEEGLDTINGGIYTDAGNLDDRDSICFTGSRSDYKFYDNLDGSTKVTDIATGFVDTIFQIEKAEFSNNSLKNELVINNIYSEMALLSNDAYNNSSTGVSHSGWTFVHANQLGLSTRLDTAYVFAPNEKFIGTMRNGVYSVASTLGLLSNEAVAHVYEGNWGGEKTVALAFRGTDGLGDVSGWFDSLTDYYNLFKPLLEGLKTYVNETGVQNILVTGHSLGGLLAQRFMNEVAGDIRYIGATFGSPGSGLTAQSDSRMVHFAHAEDLVANLSLRYSGEQIWIPRNDLNSTVDDGLGTYEHNSQFYIDDLINLAAVSDLGFMNPVPHSPGQKTSVYVDSDYASSFGGDDSIIFGRSDLLYGQGGNDTIFGFYGDDTLYGGLGNDSLTGGIGSDVLIGESGTDKLEGGIGSNRFEGTVADLSGDRITDMAGGDRIRVLNTVFSSVTYDATAGTLSIPNSTTKIYLGPQSTASNFFTTIFGSPFSISAGSGYTDIVYNGAITRIGSSLANVLTGGTSNDKLQGQGGNDLLESAAGNDTVEGGDGDDTIIGGEGAGDDIYTGGAGVDTVKYISALAGIVVNLGATSNQAKSSGTSDAAGIGIDQLSMIENVISGNYGDSIVGSTLANVLDGMAGNDSLTGGAGNDTLIGGDGADTAYYTEKTGIVAVMLSGSTVASVTVAGVIEDKISYIENLQGGSGNDVFVGDSLANAFYGNGGNDSLSGGAGADTLRGGVGVDTLNGGADGDTADYGDKTGTVSVILSGATIVDVKIAGVNEDKISYIENVIGGSVNDTFVGDGLANTLIGNAGNDSLNGGAGNDVLKGGLGLDTLVGGTESDTADYSDKTTAVTATLNGVTVIDVKIAGVNEDQISEIENLKGGSANDVLVGDTLANTLSGNAGNDSLSGMAGNDWLDGGSGNDTLIGGIGNDTYVVNAVLDIVTELSGEGTDLIQSTISYSLVDTDGAGLNGGHVENLQLLGSATINATGNSLNNTIYANAGSYVNVIDGSTGTDTLSYQYATTTGTAGITLSLGETPDSSGYVMASGISGEDKVKQIENISGSNFADTLTGNAGANVLNGLTGNDTLSGGAGSDNLNGGLGLDTLLINAVVGTSSDSGRVVVTNTSTSLNNDKGQDTLTSFNLAEDIINVVATNVNSFVHGTDTAIGLAGTDVAGTKTSFTTSTGLIELNQTTNDNWGDAGDIALTFVSPSATLTEAAFEARLQYNLTGTSGNDALTGGSLNDVFYGGLGADTLNGGLGDDTYVVSTTSGVVTELAGQGTDLIQSTVSYSLVDTDGTGANGGNVENLKLGGIANINGTGNALDNVIYVNNGAYINLIDGGSGNDTLSYQYANTTGTTGVTLNLSVVNASSQATASGISGADLVKNIENLIGSNYADKLTGNSLANMLNGGSGNDTIDGSSGDDLLIGGAGMDSLIGGLGNDTFDFNALSELGVATTRDVISDWNAGDVIDLRTIDWNTTTAGDQAFTYLGAAAFTATAGQVRYASGVLQFNTDTDTAAEYEILIMGISPATLTPGTDLLL